MPNGTRNRITGTPNTDTKVAAEAAERAHIDRILHPERFATLAAEVVPKRKEMPTLKQFAERFMAEYKPKQKPSERRSKKSIITGCNGLNSFFGYMRLDEIDQPAINRYVDSLKVEPKTINNKLTVLSTLLRYAGPDGCKLIPETTLHFHVELPPSEEVEIVAVAPTDVVRLIVVSPDQMKLAIKLAAWAGLRIGEIRGLQHTDVIGDSLMVRRAIDQANNVGTPKHDRVRRVPLTAELKLALATVPQRGRWVISTTTGESVSYDRLLEDLNAMYLAAGVTVPVSEKGVTMPWHSLRHTYGTEATRNGVAVKTLAKLMGHRDIKTTMRYLTVTDRDLDDAMARLGNAWATHATENKNADSGFVS